MEAVLNFIFSPIGIQIILAAFIILNILSGYRRGFIQKILSLSSIVLSIVMSSIFTPTLVSLFRENTALPDRITDSILNGIMKGLNLESGAVDPGPLGKMMGLDKLIDPDNIANSLRSNIESGITVAIVTVISALIIFIVTLILLKVVSHFFEYLNDIPFLGRVNKILGGVLGFFIAMFMVWIIFAVVRVLEGMNVTTDFASTLKSIGWVSYIYEQNLIYNFFSGLFS